MEKNQKLFTAGQFAKLHNINKRTLHYYDDIGLFSPFFKGENDYRYYTYMQSADLEMILTLRELDMSIDEIINYRKNKTEQAFCNLVSQKSRDINEEIKRLKEIRSLMQNKEKTLQFLKKIDLDKIEIIQYPEEHLLISQSITGAYDENDFAVLINHSKSTNRYRLFNLSYGCMILADKIISRDFTSYGYFFTRMEKVNARLNIYTKPAGRYIRAFCKGDWDKLPETYCRILDFAKEQNVTLKAYAFEEGMNEIAIQKMEEYITMITILCEEESSAI